MEGNLAIVSDGDQKAACANAPTMFTNTYLNVIQYKWLTWTYVTLIKLNRYNENVPDVRTK